MLSGRDGAGHPYHEFEMSSDERIRVTYVPHAEWAEGPTVRIQKRGHTGRVSPGPEFPADKLDDLVAALEAARRDGEGSRPVSS